MAIRDYMLGIFNSVALLLSLPIIGSGFWLKVQIANSYVKFLQWPLVVLGVVMLVVALVGVLGAFLRISALVRFYQFIMLPLIMCLIAFVIFLYMATRPGQVHIQPKRPNYFQDRKMLSAIALGPNKLTSNFDWDTIKNGLNHTDMCAKLNQTYEKARDLFDARLTPMQSGCCMPRTECGFTFVRPTYWIGAINMSANSDCLRWSNNQTQLCYGCDTCKSGFMEQLKMEWRTVGALFLSVTIVLIVVYLLGCCSYRNAKRRDLFRKRG